MREIKFRAYDKKVKKMFPVHSLEWNKISNSLAHLSGVDIHDKDSDHEGDVYYGGTANKKTGTPPVDRYVLMQYTGLKDRNDKEIYEGDIAKDGETIYEVLWVEKSAKFGAKVLKSKSVLCRGMTFPLQHYVAENTLYCVLEVIGNIYENPELLEAPHG